MTAAASQARKLAIQLIEREVGTNQMAVLNWSLNLDHQRELFFVHNPKAMGTSIKAWLGLRTDNADHHFPTLSVNKALWERYTTVLVVRHPLERFLSSYHYHCRSDYSGGYMTKYPGLKSMDMETYYHRMIAEEPYVLAPQWKYATHLLSDEPVDFCIKMGEPGSTLVLLAARLGLAGPIPQLNRTSGPKSEVPPKFRKELVDYYRLDFDMFGYSP